MKFDQHFMVDKKVLSKVVSTAKLVSDDVVLEIGPGTGNLTKMLLEKTKNIFAFEIDADLIRDLRKLGVKVLKANALKVKWPYFDKLVANIPYSICEPLLWKLMRENFKLAVLTSPLDFAEKLLDDSTKVGFMADLFFDVKIIQEVEKSAFDPQPKVKSAIITLKHKKVDGFIVEVASQYDKKLKKALVEALIKTQSLTKKQAKELIDSYGLSEKLLNTQVRMLSLKDLKQLNL